MRGPVHTPSYEEDAEFLGKLKASEAETEDRYVAAMQTLCEAQEKLASARLDEEVKQAQALESQATKEVDAARQACTRPPYLQKKVDEANARMSKVDEQLQTLIDNMVRAAKEGHLAELQRSLGVTTDPQQRKWGGRKVDINSVDTHGCTALLAATTNDRKVVVQFLLQAGATVNAKNKYGRTALHTGSIYGFSDIVSALLEAQAEVNVQDSKGRTALYEAALNAHEAVLFMLIDPPGQRQAWKKSSRGWSAAQEATSRGHTAVANLLMQAEESAANDIQSDEHGSTTG